MDRVAIYNLVDLVNCSFANICLNPSDLAQLLVIPEQKKRYYKGYKRYTGPQGFMVKNNGQTACWSDWQMKPNMIKICKRSISMDNENKIDNELANRTGLDWSEPMSFAEEGSSIKIYKMMKFQAFW